jgi:hypothetical protein
MKTPHQDYMRQNYNDSWRGTKYKISFTFYGVYRILLFENDKLLGSIAENSSFIKINAIWDYLSRQRPLVWITIHQEQTESFIENNLIGD